MDAVGDVRDRHVVDGQPGPERREHRARHLAVQAAHAVHARRQADAERSHVEDARIAAGLGSERQQALQRQPRGDAVRAEVARHQVVGEAVDAGGHGRVRREGGARAHDLERVPGSAPPSTRTPHALDAEEAGVALVHVEHVGLEAEGGERLHAADAEQDLLAQPVLAVAAVEAVGDGALGGRVVRHVGVEQEQRNAADVDPPDARVQPRPGARRDLSGAPSASSTGVSGSGAGSRRRMLLLLAARRRAPGGSSRCGRRGRRRRSARRGRWPPSGGRRPGRRGRRSTAAAPR